MAELKPYPQGATPRTPKTPNTEKFTGILQATPHPVEKYIEIFVNGKPVTVPNKCNLVEACRIGGVYVPTLCYHPRLQPIGKCGLCNVQVEGASEPVLGCSSNVTPGMRLKTDTNECKVRTQQALSRIIGKTRARQPEEFAAAPELAHLVSHTVTSQSKDSSSNALVLDLTKCVECSRCVRVCRDVQGLGIWKNVEGAVVPISTSTGAPLADTMCVSCGQCSLVCPSGALMEKRNFKVMKDALKSGKVCVVQVAPSVRVTVGEEFGMKSGSIATGQLVMALKRAGFHFVFDTDFAADLTIFEEGTEFAKRLVSGKGPFPMFSSCCPCWINLLEKEYPSMIPHMSTCKSPQAMLGAVIKTHWAKLIGKKPEDIFSVSVMPCVAKKDEILRPDLSRDGVRDIDYVMTTRECADFLKEMGIDAFELSLPFDNPMGIATGAGHIFGATGGVTEAVLRTAAEKVAGERQSLQATELVLTRGFDGIKTTDVLVAGHKVRVGVVHGISNIKRFMAEMERVGGPEYCGYQFVEIMGCPGGCIGGGGQPKSNDPEILIKRSKALYSVDEHAEIRRSHENPAVLQLYKDFLGEPNSHKSHELLHTHYVPQEVTKREAKKALAEAGPVDAKEGEQTIAIAYATVGGNTEGVARTIFNDLKHAKLNVKLWPMDQCNPSDLLNITTAVILTSTFGDGEKPPQAGAFWDWLAGQQDKSALKHLSYAVFGLGSSKYSRFNLAGKDFDFKFEGLGANRMINIGLGDDNAEDGFNTALEPWLAQLYEELGVAPAKVALVPHYRLCLCLEASFPVPPPIKTMYAGLTELKLVTPETYNRPVTLMEFDLSGCDYEYNVGDAIGIHPQNATADVAAFLRWYNVNAEAIVSIFPLEGAAPLPIPAAVTVQHLFERYMDLFSRPRKLFFRQLAQFAKNEAEKKQLQLLSSREGAAELTKYLQTNPSYEDVLRDFPSAHPTLDFLLEMVPLIKPRLYSVASSPRSVGRKVQLLIGIPTEITRARGKIRGGLATCWLYTLKSKQDAVPVNVHEGMLRPPQDSKSPILMVALGTGMAPMRALMQDRLVDKKEGKETGPAVLYQACRYSNKDFICQDEMSEYKKAGVLTEHIGAFSHQDPHRFETADMKIAENPAVVWKTLSASNAYFYYCGPAAYNIPVLIETAITKALAAGGKVSMEFASQIVEKMKAEHRWLVEAF